MAYEIDWRRLRDAGWWHWAATVPLLAEHLGRGPGGAGYAFGAAVLLCAVMALYAHDQAGEVRAPAVQVRLAFLALLLLGLAPAAAWLHWLMLAGLVSNVTVGYCPLARLMSLMPWNRDEPLTAALVGRTFLSRAASGGLLRPAGDRHACACGVADFACGIVR